MQDNKTLFEAFLLADKDGNIINSFGVASNIPIAAGLVDGYGHINKFGATDGDVTAGTIWDGNDGSIAYPYPANGLVSVSSATVFAETDYVVSDVGNAYNIRSVNSLTSALNPTLTLLRGGTYRFAVNQDSQFWIQGVPGVTGLDGAQNTREILGVNNNGASTGYVTFTVPSREAQNEFLFPGNNTVSVVSTKLFSEVNGLTVSQVGNIDGVTSLEGLTVMFYQTGEPNEVGFVQSFFDENGANYDVNLATPEIVAPVTLAIDETTTSQLKLSSGTTIDLVANQTVTFTAVPEADPLIGGLDVDTIYYIKDIIDSTSFTIDNMATRLSEIFSAYSNHKVVPLQTLSFFHVFRHSFVI